MLTIKSTNNENYKTNYKPYMLTKSNLVNTQHFVPALSQDIILVYENQVQSRKLIKVY